MLLAPLALLLSVLAVPIILMYVLKLRRQEYRVPSTFLWRQVMEDVQANAPWQRLRFNILLLLQLLALGAIILALARPAYSRSHVIAGDLVVIVDQSYGMQAHDVRPSRFGAALARARSLSTQLGDGNVMSVIGMSAQPKLAVAESSSSAAIADALNRLHAGVDEPNFLDALSLAASLARTGQSTRVVVLTSRESGISTLPLRVSFPVDIIRIGGPLRDLGITGFSASQRPTAVQAVARVSNFGVHAAHADLELFVDGSLGDVRPLTVAAHHQVNLFWSDIPASAHRLQVKLTGADDVSTDKSAWAVIPGAAPRRVLLVSPGDYFLEAALVDDPTVQLTAIPPRAYTPELEQGYDLAIFDGVLPTSFPVSSSLLIAPPSGQLGSLRFGASRRAGTVQASTGTIGPAASILRYVDLSDVHVAAARTVTLPGWMQPLASAGHATVLAAGERNTTRIALVNFDLQHSDWPLRISFPVVLHNLVPYLAPGLTLGETTITSGKAVTFFPPPGTQKIEVTRPDGAVVTVAPPFPPFTDTSRTGLYTVQAVEASAKGQHTASGELTTSFAVDFFPARPAPASGPATVHTGHLQPGQTLAASVPVSVVWVFEALALAILAAEWWVSFRGVRIV